METEKERLEFLCALFGFDMEHFSKEAQLWGMIASEFYGYKAKANRSDKDLVVAPSSGNEVWLARNTNYEYDKGPVCK